MSKFNEFRGSVVIKTNMNMFDTGKKLSTFVFNNCKFNGLEDYIYEEIPAIYFEFMGLRFILTDGLPNQIVLRVEPRFYIIESDMEYKYVNLDLYLFQLLKEKLKDIPDIEVIMTEWPE